MRIDPFAVEQWMNSTEQHCRYNLAETCVASLTVQELLDLTGRGPQILADLANLHLTYGQIPGSSGLRERIAGLYNSIGPENVLVTHGAAGANALVHTALIAADDVVIPIMPAYQQHYSIPAALGAQLRPVWLREETGWALDLDELAAAAGGGAKAIVLTNPNNPTGALLSEPELRRIAEIAETARAWIISDEVYRGTDQSDPGVTTSLVDLTDRAVAVGSMSKAFSLAGLRLGWVAGPTALLEEVAIHRDYTTISVSQLDDLLAGEALGVASALLQRSRQLTRTNLAVLDAWVTNRPDITYVKPSSGTTALLRYRADLGSYEFCERLLAATGVLLSPGAAFEVEGTCRIGYANQTSVLRAGLGEMGRFLDSLSRRMSDLATNV